MPERVFHRAAPFASCRLGRCCQFYRRGRRWRRRSRDHCHSLYPRRRGRWRWQLIGRPPRSKCNRRGLRLRPPRRGQLPAGELPGLVGLRGGPGRRQLGRGVANDVLWPAFPCRRGNLRAGSRGRPRASARIRRPSLFGGGGFGGDARDPLRGPPSSPLCMGGSSASSAVPGDWRTALCQAQSSQALVPVCTERTSDAPASRLCRNRGGQTL